jgi:hypothetical protein
MASSLETSGSLADRLNAVVVLIRSCPDLGSLRYRHTTIVRRMEACVERARLFRARTGRPPQLDGLDWLDQVVRDHPAFEPKSADAVAMQAELQSLIARISRGA